MVTTLYLPKAHNPNIGNPKVQQWVSMPENGADELASKLGIPDRLLESQIIGAIPTPWARMLLFEQALLDDSHPLHKSILAEWRGLLACFCYHNYAGFKFTVEPINLDELRTDNRDSRVGEAFKKAKPDSTPTWERFDLICINDIVVGAASPRTIVFCTAENLNLRNVPWIKAGRFIDPLEYYQKEEDRRLLAGWLDEAITKINNSYEDLPNKGKIVDLLAAWKSDAKVSEVIKEAYTAFPNFTLSLLPLTPEGAVRDIRSDVMLQPSKSFAKPPLLVSELILKDDVRRIYQGIRGNRQLAQQLPKGLSGDQFSKEIPYPWLNPDELFTDVLVQVTTLNANHTYFLQLPNDERTFLFPLKREILDYFHPYELPQRVSIRPAGSGIQVILRLPITSGMRQEEVSRTYSKLLPLGNVNNNPEKGTIIYVDTPPVMEMWPNFQHEQWKKHYLFISLGISAQSGMDLQFALYPEAPQPKLRQKGSAGTAVAQELVWKTEKTPEAVIFYLKEAAGILPICQLQTLKLSNVQVDCNVAVDFGQSNTTVFWAPPNAQQGAQCDKVVFKSRNIPLTNVVPATRENVLRNGFLPGTDITTSLDSSLITFPKVPDGNKGIINGNIYLPNVFQGEYSEEAKERISAGLKWADDRGDNDKVTILLEQLVTMIEAEALADNRNILEYRWAYPQAFSGEMVTTFQARWNTLTTGKKNTENTESLAICQYLAGTAAQNILHGNSLFGIDIGGSTTDIGVWARNQMVIRDSCRLAGWTQSKLLCHNKDIVDMMMRLLNARIEMPVDNTILTDRSENKVAMYWNRLLRFCNEKGLLETFISEIQASRDENCRLVVTAAVATFSVMAFYAGILAASYFKSEHVTLPGNKPRLYFTGNGGNLLLWLPGGRGNLNIFLWPLFREGYMIVQSSLPHGWDSIEVTLPSHPKDEVAIGLLLKQSSLQEKSQNLTITGDSGLKFSHNKRESVPPHTHLDAKQFAALEVPQGWTSDSLKRFVDVFNRTSREKGLGLRELPDPGKMHSIGDHLRDKVSRANAAISQNDEGSGVKLESPFVIAAESYLNQVVERGRW